jgi:hypothetical protein
MMELKWSLGEPYERSRRRKHDNNNNNNNNNNKEEIEAAKIQKQQITDAYTSALNYDENTWDILNQSCANDNTNISNKREDLDMKIANRDLVKQTGNNPFLSSDNYADDISIRDKFLKPQNTSNV